MNSCILAMSMLVKICTMVHLLLVYFIYSCPMFSFIQINANNNQWLKMHPAQLCICSWCCWWWVELRDSGSNLFLRKLSEDVVAKIQNLKNKLFISTKIFIELFPHYFDYSMHLNKFVSFFSWYLKNTVLFEP